MSIMSSRYSLPEGQIPISTTFADVDFAMYALPESTVSNDNTTVTLSSTSLSRDPAALRSFLDEQISLPPRPLIYLDATGRGASDDVAFSIRVDLLRHCLPQSDSPLRLAHLEHTSPPITVCGIDEKRPLLSQAEVNLAEKMDAVVREFCSATDHNKKLVLDRIVTNINEDWIEGKVREVISALGYRGRSLRVRFIAHHSRIVVRDPLCEGYVMGRMRQFLGHTSPKYTLRTVWPCAKVSEGTAPHYIFQSEQELLEEWMPAIQNAVRRGRKCWLGEADKIEAAMSGFSKGLSI